MSHKSFSKKEIFKNSNTLTLVHMGHLWVVRHILEADWSHVYSIVVAAWRKKIGTGGSTISPIPTCSTPATALIWLMCATTS